MSKTFFPQRPEANPTIYAYEDSNPAYKGLLKVGFTNLDAQTRVAQQYPVLRPGEPPYRIVLEEPAMRNDGTVFSDHDVHRFLRKKGLRNPNGEWFECTVEDVKSAILTIKSGVWFEENRTLDFPMRPEQQAAVEKTIAYFRSFKEENPGKTPHFLWNAKMRFGKTFAAYQLAKAMGWRKILVLTFKPAVQSAWEEDLMTHVDFSGWQFLSRNGSSMEVADTSRPLVCFGSFQDFLGKNEAGGIKARNEWVHTTNWDCVILDEYHYGAWRENAKDLFDAEEKREVQFAAGAGLEWFDEEIMPITTDHYLYLSGTPFRAIASGEFIEEQIYNWTYSDEQRAKAEWKGEPNPYAALPRMVLLTYQLPPSIQDVIKGGEFDEFDLNEFFKAEGEGGQAIFRHMNEVQKWLDLIRGSYLATTVDNLKLGAQKPPMPFSDVRLLGVLNHTFWFLPSVAACHAMANLLGQPQNRFYHEYRIVVAAGSAAGIGVDALPPVLDTMENPLKTKSITLSCGKLTTGVSVKPWTGIFMLRNSSSPETYFQAAFRVQTPWTIKNPDNLSPNKEVILKNECYIFDFAPDRALRQIADYSCRLNVNEDNPEKKVAEFIKFLPVLAYDGSSMKQVDAAGILDMAMSGTTATLLARRWESALLVNVDNGTLTRLLNNEAAMEALRKIEGFRSLNQDIETIINKSENIKRLKREANERHLTPEEKKELTKEEKEYKSKRKEIQEKLIKFATRIPVFLYLTDYRERTLKDVITKLEPGLFKKVTGLDVKDFELLVSLGVFNSALMNDAVYKFKRYEDSSLVYTGIDKHRGKAVGLYDTVLSEDDYRMTFVNEAAVGYEG
ncbi:MAG: type III restriction endonuclease [Chlorobiota bacterium]